MEMIKTIIKAILRFISFPAPVTSNYTYNIVSVSTFLHWVRKLTNKLLLVSFCLLVSIYLFGLQVVRFIYLRLIPQVVSWLLLFKSFLSYKLVNLYLRICFSSLLSSLFAYLLLFSLITTFQLYLVNVVYAEGCPQMADVVHKIEAGVAIEKENAQIAAARVARAEVLAELKLRQQSLKIAPSPLIPMDVHIPKPIVTEPLPVHIPKPIVAEPLPVVVETTSSYTITLQQLCAQPAIIESFSSQGQKILFKLLELEDADFPNVKKLATEINKQALPRVNVDSTFYMHWKYDTNLEDEDLIQMYGLASESKNYTLAVYLAQYEYNCSIFSDLVDGVRPDYMKAQHMFSKGLSKLLDDSDSDSE